MQGIQSVTGAACMHAPSQALIAWAPIRHVNVCAVWWRPLYAVKVGAPVAALHTDVYMHEGIMRLTCRWNREYACHVVRVQPSEVFPFSKYAITFLRNCVSSAHIASRLEVSYIAERTSRPS